MRVRARYRGDQLTEGQDPWATPWSGTATITIASQTTDPTPEPTPSPPGAPAGLTGTAAHNEVELTWNDPRDTSITSYQILRWQRGVHDPGDFQVYVDDTGSAGTGYTDTDVEAEARYVYRIKARNAGGLSARSNYFNADLPAAPAVPNAPTGLTSSNTYIAIVLSWDDPGDDSITGYQVLRRDRSDAASQFEVLADDTESTATSYTDSHIAPKAEYEYQVKARNEHGLSAAGAAHSVDVPADPDAITTGAIDLGDLTAVTEARSPEYEINGHGDRLDYFRFTLTEPRQVSLELREMDFDADLLLFKDDTSLTQLAESRTDGTGDEAITETLLEGSYLVLVTAEEQGENSYELRHGTAGPDPDRVEVLREEATVDDPPPAIQPVDPPPSSRAVGDITLVSNITTTTMIFNLSSGWKVGTSFRTGDHGNGYFITEVTIALKDDDIAADRMTVTLNEGYAANPGRALQTFNNPSSIVDGENTFTLDTPYLVEPGNAYVVLISASGTVVSIRARDAGDQTGVDTNWRIGDSSRAYRNGAWEGHDQSIMFSVTGQENDQDPRLVHNLGESNSSSKAIPNNGRIATMFTTGDNPNGYRVDRVRISWASGNNANDQDDLRVRVFEANADNTPEDKLADFVGPTRYAADGRTYTFYAPAGLVLKPGTSYFLMIKGSGAAIGSLRLTTSNDQSGKTGWTIEDDSLYALEGDDWAAETGSLKFSLLGSEVPSTTLAILNPTELNVTEGESGSYTVVLGQQPPGNATVTITQETDLLTIPSTTLPFTTQNWNQAHTVEFTARQDDDGDHALRYDVTHTVTGFEDNGDPVILEVYIEDDDEKKILFNPTSLNFQEGQSASYTVRLSTEPRFDVSVDIQWGATGLFPTFTRTRWSSPQRTGTCPRGSPSRPSRTATQSTASCP